MERATSTTRHAGRALAPADHAPLEAELRRSQERLQRLAAVADARCWEQDEQLRFTWISGAEADAGATPGGSMLGRCLWGIDGLAPARGHWDEHRALMCAHQPFANLELAGRAADGTVQHLSASGEPVYGSRGEFVGYRGVVRDITREVVERRLLQLEHDIVRCIAQSDSLGTAVMTVMRMICECDGWECGDYWGFDASTHTRTLLYSWGIADPVVQRFIERSRGMVLGLEEGNVGLVYQTGQPFWMADLLIHTGVTPRAVIGREAGMRGVFVLPVVSGGQMLAAISFNCRQVREPDLRVLNAFVLIGSQMGEFFARKQAEQVMRASEQRFRALTALSSDWYWEEDHQGRFKCIEGPGALKMAHFVGKTAEEVGFVAEHGWDVYNATKQAHGAYREKVLSFQVGAQTRYLSISGEPTFDDQHRFTGYRGVSRDITERKEAEERINHLALHDSLTGLPNRVMFGRDLSLTLAAARRYGRKFAVLFIDLDRFKTINDSLGHDAGDQLLCEVARRIQATVRQSDLVARLGGDEFVVLLHEAQSGADVMAASRKILSAVIEPMTLVGQDCRVTASIGISMYPADALDEATLMKNADMAMYMSKEGGKNMACLYTGENQSRAVEKMAMESNLRQAIVRNEFTLAYQAKLDLVSNRIVGVEALLRWNCAALGSVSPAQFIPLAEETGLIVPIGKWVLRTACEQAVAWQREGLPAICVAVNLSPRQFSDPDLLSDVAAVLEATGLAPNLLELEITEGMVMRDTERAIALLGAIKALGVNLAIDDFGTGYSSLAQLRRFPINTLKVDRSFIREITHNAGDKAITEAIINMGRSLSLTVIAEGVETAEQMDLLRDKSCDQIQGYHFSKPVAPEQFAALVRRHDPAPPQEGA